jgi:hypothetical protein
LYRYNAVFKNLIDHQPIPMDTLESLASSAVRGAHKVGAELIVCLAKSGRTAQLLVGRCTLNPADPHPPRLIG